MNGGLKMQIFKSDSNSALLQEVLTYVNFVSSVLHLSQTFFINVEIIIFYDEISIFAFMKILLSEDT